MFTSLSFTSRRPNLSVCKTSWWLRNPLLQTRQRTVSPTTLKSTCFPICLEIHDPLLWISSSYFFGTYVTKQKNISRRDCKVQYIAEFS
jgi:hypothetical protein